MNEDWFRDGVIYQIHVRAFADSNGDGTGDFDGLTSRLDYLSDLGVTAVWLLPFYPSPLRDDGYDIADYRTINPDYGTLRAFRRFLDAAHARNIKVITELVINHTSDQHPWFERARRAPRAHHTATSTSGPTIPRSGRTPGSSSRTSRRRTGPGIRWPASTTGTASTRTSPT